MMRPPSRHKEPPKSLGLDLPPHQDDPYIDEDSDDSFGFEIGLDLAAKQQNNNNN